MSEQDKIITERTHKLLIPVEYGDETIYEVVVKRPKGKHIKNLGRNVSMKDLILIAGKVTGHAPSFFDEVDAADVTAITEIVGDFLSNGQETGEI